MAYVKSDAFEKLICELFRGRAFPGTFYLGLGSGPLPAETATLASVAAVEVAGPGYARKALVVGTTDFPGLQIVNGDWKVTAKQVTFGAVGGDWAPQAEWVFLTDGTNFYGAVSVPAVVILSGDTFDVVFEYQDS